MDYSTAKNILEKNTLRVTPPNEFNDPFELMMQTFSDISFDSIKKIY